MNFYSQRHPFYCGIDLHANQMYACVVDQAGKKHRHRNYIALIGDVRVFSINRSR